MFAILIIFIIQVQNEQNVMHFSIFCMQSKDEKSFFLFRIATRKIFFNALSYLFPGIVHLKVFY